MTIPDASNTVRVGIVSMSREGSSLEPTGANQLDVVARCRRWRKAFRDCDVAYPARALSMPLAARWIRRHGCLLDAHLPQDIAFGVISGVPPNRVIFHCNSAAEPMLTDVLRMGIGQFIVDCDQSALRLAARVERPQHILIDVTSDEADGVISAVSAEELLITTGLYREALTVEEAVLPMLERMADARRNGGVMMRRIGIAVPGRRWRTPKSLAAAICGVVEDGCAKFQLPRPAVTVFADWLAVTRELA